MENVSKIELRKCNFGDDFWNQVNYVIDILMRAGNICVVQYHNVDGDCSVFIDYSPNNMFEGYQTEDEIKALEIYW